MKPKDGEFEPYFDLLFFCPGCKCGHGVILRQVDESKLSPTDWQLFVESKRPRWTFNDDFKKPTFSPSILVR